MMNGTSKYLKISYQNLNRYHCNIAVDGDSIVLKDYPVSEKCTRTPADRMMERATATSPDR